MASATETDRACEELLEQIAGIARQLAEASTLDETLQRIVDLAEDYLNECSGASLMLVRGRRSVSTPAFSSKVAYESDLLQYETGEGPCLDAIRDHQVFVIDDLETDDRWPDYRGRALELGVRSMLSFRLFIAEDTMGALDMYSARAHAFDGHATALGQVFASHASVAMKAAITEAGLERAIETRDLIGQAKGIIMEREKLTADEAFARLRELSQARNRRVSDLAETIVTSGELPEPL